MNVELIIIAVSVGSMGIGCFAVILVWYLRRFCQRKYAIESDTKRYDYGPSIELEHQKSDFDNIYEEIKEPNNFNPYDRLEFESTSRPTVPPRPMPQSIPIPQPNRIQQNSYHRLWFKRNQ